MQLYIYYCCNLVLLFTEIYYYTPLIWASQFENNESISAAFHSSITSAILWGGGGSKSVLILLTQAGGGLKLRKTCWCNTWTLPNTQCGLKAVISKGLSNLIFIVVLLFISKLLLFVGLFQHERILEILKPSVLANGS